MLKMNWISFIGFVAAISTTVGFVPQVVKSWKTKKTNDLSLGMYSITTTGIFLWLVYGLMIADLPLIIANSISFALVSSLLIMKLVYG